MRIGTVNRVTYPDSYRPDDIWRRPAGDHDAGLPSRPSEPAAPLTTPESAYAGPPRSAPPDPDWQPKVLVRTPEARRLPAQNQDALDEIDRNNAALTRGIGLVAGAIGLILLFIVCGRLVF